MENDETFDTIMMAMTEILKQLVQIRNGINQLSSCIFDGAICVREYDR